MTEQSESFTRMLEKVRKILNKAEDPACTPEEAEAFNDKAAELIAKFGIDMALLAKRDPTTDKVKALRMVFPSPYSMDKMMLCHLIAKAYRCETIQLTKKDAGGNRILRIVGFESDLRRTEFLYTHLLIQAQNGMLHAEIFYRPENENLKSYKTSWFRGFSNAIYDRLQLAEKQAVRDGGTGTDLVVFDRSTEVKNAFTDEYPHIRKSGRTTSNGSGAGSGYMAGQQADINAGRLTSGNKALAQ